MFLVIIDYHQFRNSRCLNNIAYTKFQWPVIIETKQIITTTTKTTKKQTMKCHLVCITYYFIDYDHKKTYIQF